MAPHNEQDKTVYEFKAKKDADSKAGSKSTKSSASKAPASKKE